MLDRNPIDRSTVILHNIRSPVGIICRVIHGYGYARKRIGCNIEIVAHNCYIFQAIAIAPIEVTPSSITTAVVTSSSRALFCGYLQGPRR